MQKTASSSFKILNALIYSIRPSATLGTCLLVLAAFNPDIEELKNSTILMVSVFSGSAFCFLVNDIYDRKKDLMNNKKRPIATGLVPLSIARNTSAFFGLLLLTTSWFLGIHAFVLAISFLIATSVYSYVNSQTGLLANIIVALLVAGTQWGVALLKPEGLLWVTSFFLFLLTIPREMMLDWLDMPGDKQSGKPSFPMNHSAISVKWLVVLCLIGCSVTIYFVSLNTFSLTLFVLAVLSAWASFAPFLKKADSKRALLSVRATHITFALLILALLSR